MLKNLLDYKEKISLIIALVSLLAMVRFFETTLFYDPFLVFFKGEFHNLPLPQYNNFQLFIGLFFRYLLNSLLSLGIIYVVFKKTALVQFAGILYAIFFVLLILAFFAMLYFYSAQDNLKLFYIRRFLIQPILLLLFLPAFYYQQQQTEK
jgi:exosortase F-associated protein